MPPVILPCIQEQKKKKKPRKVKVSELISVPPPPAPSEEVKRLAQQQLKDKLQIKQDERRAKKRIVASKTCSVHNVFTLVDPQYLKLKPYKESLNNMNSLGIDNFRQIFFLGYWKKLVYTMNLECSLDLCYKFSDHNNFRILYEKLPED